MTWRAVDNRDLTNEEDYLRARVAALRVEVDRLAQENADLRRQLHELLDEGLNDK